MATLIAEPLLPLEAGWEPSPREIFRDAIALALTTDPGLLALLAPFDPESSVMYRMAREPVRIPSVTFFDFGRQADDVVALTDRVLQVDTWALTRAEAERLAKRVLDVLARPLVLAAGFDPVFLRLRSDRDNIAAEGTLGRKTLEFRVLGYDR